MKKILVILIMAPVFAFAQQRMPHFPIDSLSGHIQYSLKIDFPGDDKKKIFDVMIKWFSGDGRGKNQGVLLDNKDDKSMLTGVTCFIAPWQSQLPHPLNGGTQYLLVMEVKDEHVSILLSGFEIKTDDGLVTLEDYRDQIIRIESKQASALSSLPSGFQSSVKTYNQNYNNSQSDMLADINLTACDLLRDAQKFVKKARKQQLL